VPACRVVKKFAAFYFTQPPPTPDTARQRLANIGTPQHRSSTTQRAMQLTLAMLAGAAATVSAAVPTVTLNNGVEMPLVALGVWQYDNATAKDAITKGLALGYTHFDTGAFT
jgi:hypothetical protein